MERMGREVGGALHISKEFWSEEKLLPGFCSRAQCFLIVWVLCFYCSPRNWGLGELWLWFARSTKADGILKLHPLKTLYALTWATDWCLFLKHLEGKFTTFSRFLNHPCPLPYPHKECLRDCAQKLLMAYCQAWTSGPTSGPVVDWCGCVFQCHSRSFRGVGRLAGNHASSSFLAAIILYLFSSVSQALLATKLQLSSKCFVRVNWDLIFLVLFPFIAVLQSKISRNCWDLFILLVFSLSCSILFNFQLWSLSVVLELTI